MKTTFAFVPLILLLPAFAAAQEREDRTLLTQAQMTTRAREAQGGIRLVPRAGR